MTELAERLLEAHLRHELARCSGPGLRDNIAQQLHAIFEWFKTIELADVVTREQIEGVIERYVIELRPSGGITELSGEMSRVVFGSSASRETRVADVVAPDSYDEFADKLLALEGVRRELIARVARSETFAALSAQMLARGVLDLLAPPLPLREGALASGVRELLGRLSGRVLPGLERRAAETLGRYLGRHRERMARDSERHLLEVLEPAQLRAMVDEVWDGVATLPLSEAFALIGEQDIEDFVVLVYEFWLRYRKSEFFRRVAREMIDHFFTKYGQDSVASVIDDMGVTEAMVVDELDGFLRPILDHAARTGFLEQQLRQRLASFYRSAAFAEATQR